MVSVPPSGTNGTPIGSDYWKQEAESKEAEGTSTWKSPTGGYNVPVGQNVEESIQSSGTSGKLSPKDKLVAMGKGFLHTLNPLNWPKIAMDIDRSTRNAFNMVVEHFKSE